MDQKDGDRVEVLLNRGEADVWYAGTAEGVNVRLDDYPYGEPLVTVADIMHVQPELDPKGHYLWTITDERTGKRRKTSYRMQPADARLRHPDAWPDLASKEVRHHIGNAGEIEHRVASKKE